MKGLILSGGKGTRLRPITHTSAKQLVPVANKPVVFYGLEALVGAGIRDIGIVVGDTQAEIRAAVGDGSRWGASITDIEQDAPRGLAHAVLISEPFIGRDPFVMYLGDTLLNRGIAPFVERFERERPAAPILLARVPDPQMFGVGAGAKIAGAYIGPFTAGDRITIRETEIEHSIVLEGAVITDIANRIEDSLIGKDVSIYRLPVRPSAYRFMLGDHSEVGIRW
jgi:NDP-sugar pyrophosphorylase family protein